MVKRRVDICQAILRDMIECCNDGTGCEKCPVLSDCFDNWCRDLDTLVRDRAYFRAMMDKKRQLLAEGGAVCQSQGTSGRRKESLSITESGT